MATFKVLPFSGKGSCLADPGVGKPKTFAEAKRIADDGKKATGADYRVVKTEEVYVTRTLDEAINDPRFAAIPAGIGRSAKEAFNG